MRYISIRSWCRLHWHNKLGELFIYAVIILNDYSRANSSFCYVFGFVLFDTCKMFEFRNIPFWIIINKWGTFWYTERFTYLWWLVGPRRWVWWTSWSMSMFGNQWRTRWGETGGGLWEVILEETSSGPQFTRWCGRSMLLLSWLNWQSIL